MALSVSAPIRILALVGLLLAVGAGALRFVGGGSDSSSAVVPSRNSAVVHAKSVAAAASARAKHPATASAAATHKATAAKAKPVAPTHAKPLTPTHAKATAKPAKPAVTKKPAPAVSSALPLPLARALTVDPIVVAVLYNPQSEVDAIAVAEARAGAALAGTGFIALSVLSQRDVGKLTEQLGLLPDPAVLVFTRPAHLAARIDGFSDKETVAQAAHNAAHGT